jgi:phage-related protein
MSVVKIQKFLKEVFWCGDSLDIIRTWSVEVRASIGEDLRRLQKGDKPRNWKPFPGLAVLKHE